MKKDNLINQPGLFEVDLPEVEIERITLFALGEFQSRKKVLAERELPLDRLRGAFKRTAERFGLAELADEEIVESLQKMEVKVVKVPSFVAKHPFRVTVSREIAEKAKEFYKTVLEND